MRDDEHRMGPYAYKGNEWVSFDDIDTIHQKTEYIKSLKLGGAMIWALDLDDFGGSCGTGETYPLLKTINRGLGMLDDNKSSVKQALQSRRYENIFYVAGTKLKYFKFFISSYVSTFEYISVIMRFRCIAPHIVQMYVLPTVIVLRTYTHIQPCHTMPSTD